MKRLQHGGFITGLVLGLVVGLGVALAVALYVTKTPVPFIDKLPQRTAEQDAAEAERNKNWDPNAPLAGKNPARPAVAAASGLVTPASAAAEAGSPPPAATAMGTPAPAASAAERAQAAAPRPARDPAAILAGQVAADGTAKPVPRAASAVATSFFVQAGAYARTEDAEAQRAKLALLGLDARITEREQSGRTVYRVRMGPFDAREPAEDVQGRLSGAGIEANLVRVER
jgi:cell division protein FtsN